MSILLEMYPWVTFCCLVYLLGLIEGGYRNPLHIRRRKQKRVGGRYK